MIDSFATIDVTTCLRHIEQEPASLHWNSDKAARRLHQQLIRPLILIRPENLPGRHISPETRVVVLRCISNH